MITGIFIGFILALVLVIGASKLAVNYALKRRWYASATWSEKDKIWKVQGNYLSIANKIFDGIKNQDGSVKYEV